MLTLNKQVPAVFNIKFEQFFLAEWGDHVLMEFFIQAVVSRE